MNELDRINEAMQRLGKAGISAHEAEQSFKKISIALKALIKIANWQRGNELSRQFSIECVRIAQAALEEIEGENEPDS